MWPWTTEEWRERQCAKDRKDGEPWMNFAWPFLLGPVFFRTALPCSDSYHLESSGMPLHGAVGVNWKRAQLLKIKVLCKVYGLKCVCMFYDCVCYLNTWITGVLWLCVLSDLTWLSLLLFRKLHKNKNNQKIIDGRFSCIFLYLKMQTCHKNNLLFIKSTYIVSLEDLIIKSIVTKLQIWITGVI